MDSTSSSKKTQICNAPNCEKEGKLRCPNCIKLGIKDKSYFCGKECFQSYWKEHRKIHEDYEPIDDGFLYTALSLQGNSSSKYSRLHREA